MAKRPSIKEFKKIAFKDKRFVAEYEALAPEFELVRDFIKARIQASYSQKELADRLKLQQPAIARLERGGYASTSIATLTKVADALGYKFTFHLERKKRK
jgi:ribosome-binding protein aMBF1 (putative translation factor)